MRFRPLPCLALLVTLVSSTGATCPRLMQQYTQPLPRALGPQPTREQIMNVVNSNGSQVVTLYTNRASISVPGVPALRALVAYERDRNFRLRADTPFTGPEVDVGSNNELFWFWVKRNQPPALYFCRHQAFESSAAKRIVPVDPTWLVRALGVVTFEPNLNHQGPFSVSAGRLEIRTLPNTPDGNTRVTVIDETRGVVLEEHVYDRGGTRLATALLKNHRRDPASEVTLPRRVELQLPVTHLDITIDMNDIQINRLNSNQPDLWTKPTYAGFSEVDLGDPNLRLVEPAAPGGPPRAAAAGTRYSASR